MVFKFRGIEGIRFVNLICFGAVNCVVVRIVLKISLQAEGKGTKVVFSLYSIIAMCY